MNTKFIRKAVIICGSQTALAEKIGVTQPAVHKWTNGEAEKAPPQASQSEQATGGLVTRHQIRPDISPLEIPS